MALGNLLLIAVPLALAAHGRGRPKKQPSKVTDEYLQGGDFIASLPATAGELRERMIHQGVRAALHDPIRIKYVSSIGREGTPSAGYRVAIPVMHDALQFEHVRVTANYDTAQRIADELGLLMLTPFVSALIFEQATAPLTPTAPQPASTTTAAMIETSAEVTKKYRPYWVGHTQPEVHLVGNAGKDWVITRRFLEPGAHPKTGVLRSQAAANHGLYRGPFDPIQNVGLAHPRTHVDNTQTLRFMGPEIIATDPQGNDELVPTVVALQDPILGPLLSGELGKLRGKQVGEGALPFTRHPAIAPADIA